MAALVGAGGSRARLLVWTELFRPYIGGPEVLLARLLPALAERGWELSVVTSHDELELEDEETYDGVRVVRIPFRRALRSREVGDVRAALSRAAAAKRDFSPQLVFATAVTPSLFFHLRTLEARPTPWVLGLQNEVLTGQLESRHQTLLHQALQEATWVAACSGAALAQARSLAPQILPRSSVIRNAVDPASTPYGGTAPHARLLCIGRLVPAKGFDVALAAFARLRERFPSLVMSIAGDGIERAALERQASALGLDGAVEFLGWVEPGEVPTVIARSTIVLMPSRREGLPVTAVQAAMTGRPIVSTAVGGLPEVVVHDETGLHVEPDDPAGLADAVASLLADPRRAAELGAEARARALRGLSLERCVDAYDALFTSLVERRACTSSTRS